MECFTHWKAVKSQNSYSVFSQLQKYLVTNISSPVMLFYTTPQNCTLWIRNFTFEEKPLYLIKTNLFLLQTQMPALCRAEVWDIWSKLDREGWRCKACFLHTMTTCTPNPSDDSKWYLGLNGWYRKYPVRCQQFWKEELHISWWEKNLNFWGTDLAFRLHSS